MSPRFSRHLRARLRAALLPARDPHAIVDQAPTQTIRELLTRFWPDVRPYRRRIALGLALVAIVPLLETAEILLFQRVIDDAVVPRELAPLVPLVLAYLGLGLAGGVIGYLDDYLATWVGEHFLLRLRTRVYEHIQRLSPHQLTHQRLGDVHARMTGDVRAIESFMIGGIAEGLGAVLRLLVFGTTLFLLDWQLAAASLIVVPLIAVTSRTFARLIRTNARERRRRAGSLSAVAEEELGLLSLTQSLGAERDATRRFSDEGTRIIDAELAATRIRGLYAPVADLIRLVGVLSVLALGIWTMQRGSMSVGELLAFLTLLSRMYSPLRALGNLVQDMFSAAAAAERVVQLLNVEPAVRVRPGAHALLDPAGRVELQQVCFRYPGQHADAVGPVDLCVEPGEVVALVGPSGSGKSTVSMLLQRFADPTHGRVLVDGHDLRDLSIASIRERVAVLQQDAAVPDAPVGDVIRSARPSATDAEVVAAAVAAGAHDFIAALPDGYGTRVGQRGRGFSGGQRQRIALARTLLRDAAVLILDEPTSGLDAVAAERLRGPLREASDGRTTIIITHDPALMSWCDRVIALDRLPAEVTA